MQLLYCHNQASIQTIMLQVKMAVPQGQIPNATSSPSFPQTPSLTQAQVPASGIPQASAVPPLHTVSPAPHPAPAPPALQPLAPKPIKWPPQHSNNDAYPAVCSATYSDNLSGYACVCCIKITQSTLCKTGKNRHNQTVTIHIWIALYLPVC